MIRHQSAPVPPELTSCTSLKVATKSLTPSIIDPKTVGLLHSTVLYQDLCCSSKKF